MKNKSTRVRKFREYPPVRRVGVKKGHGPRHAENVLEGQEVEPLKLAGGDSNLKPGWINDQYELPSGGGSGGVKEWNAGDFEKWIEGQKPSTVASGAPTPIGGVDIPPADLGAPDPGAVLVPPVGEGGGIRGGPFQGWSPEQFNAWHSGVGVGNLGFPSFEGNMAGPGGTQLGYSTTSYDVPGYGWVPHAQLANAQASNNPQDYFNNSGGGLQVINGLGYDPSVGPYGFGSGEPTRRGIDIGLNALGNATGIPGLGFLAGKLGRGFWHMIQNMQMRGASKGDIGRAVAKAQAQAPPSESVEAPQDAVQAQGFSGWYSPNYLRSIGYTPGQGSGSLWTGGPTGGFGGGGIGGQGGSFFGQLPGVRGGPLAGGGSGASGPSNLNWGGAAFGGEGTSDRPHFNPFFGGYSANMPSKGVAVALRAKGDSDLTAKNTDTVPAMLTPREAVLNRNAAELAGRGNIEQLNAEGNKLAEKGVDLAGGKNMKTKAKKYQGGDDMVPLPAKAKNPPYNSIGGGVLGAMPPDQIGGMPQPMRARGREFGQDWISGHPMFHQNWVQDPSGGWMARRGGAGAWGQQHPVAGGGGGGSDAGRPPYPTQVAGGSPYGYNPTSGFPNVPPGGWNASNSGYTPPDNRVRGGGFYPKGMGMQSGSAEVGPIGSPNPQTAYGPPITLSAPQLQQAAQKAGLNAGQIQGLMSAVQGFGQAYSGMSDGLGGGGTGGMDAAGAFQGGISDIGYPPFVAPQAEYHADKGSSWIGRYDPAYTLPIY